VIKSNKNLFYVTIIQEMANMNIIMYFVIFFRLHNVFLGVLLMLTGGFLGLGQIQLTPSLVIAVLVIILAGMGCVALDNYWDQEVDQVVHPRRADALDHLSSRFAWISGFILFSLAIIIGFFVSISFGLFIVGGFILFLFYELVTKNRGLIGNITVAITLPLIIISGGVAVHNPYPSFVIFFISFFPILGGEILRDIRDLEGDKKNRHTLPMSIGIPAAQTLGIGFISTYLFLSPVPYLIDLVDLWYIPGIVIADIILITVIAYIKIKPCSIRSITEITKFAWLIGTISLIIGIS